MKFQGLYYKLHGCYRPSTMKKSIIKRRKRVVPAMRDQSPTAATQSSNGLSASPEASPAASGQYQVDYSFASSESAPAGQTSPQTTAQRPYTFAPPPVDFTGYRAGSIQQAHPPRLLEPERFNTPSYSSSGDFGRRSSSPGTIGNSTPNSNPNPKKRSLAEVASSADALTLPASLESGSNQLPPIMSSTQPARLSPISSLLNQADRREDTRLDPSLAALSQQQQLLPGVSEIDSYTSERRIQLQREAEQMREELRAKERELARFGI